MDSLDDLWIVEVYDVDLVGLRNDVVRVIELFEKDVYEDLGKTEHTTQVPLLTDLHVLRSKDRHPPLRKKDRLYVVAVQRRVIAGVRVVKGGNNLRAIVPNSPKNFIVVFVSELQDVVVVSFKPK